MSMTSNPTSTTLPLLRDFGDWLSPMVVKELRHGLRTRFFTSALIGFHWLLILLMASVLIGTEVEIVNGVFWTLAFVLLLGVLPLRGFSALAGESKDGTLDMLTMTSISSWKITFGKWVALFSQNVLVGFSLLPYLVARYQFGGVEVLRELVALGLLMLVSAVATAMFVGFSSQSSVVLRLFLAAGTLGAAIPGGVTIYLVGVGDSGDSLMREWSGLSSVEQVVVTASVFSVSAYAVYFFLAMGASRIAAPSENHSTVKRAVMLGTVAGLTVMTFAVGVFGDPDVGYWSFIPALVITLFAGSDLLTESTPQFPTVVAGLMQRKAPLRWIRRLFYPGWATGLLLYVVLGTLVMGMWFGLAGWGPSIDDSEWLVIVCFLLAPIVPMVLPWGRSNRFAVWWWTQGALFAAGILLIILAGVSGAREFGFLGLVTPVTTLFGMEAARSSMGKSVLAAGVGVGVFWLLAAMVKSVGEWRSYRGLEWQAKRLLDKSTPMEKGGDASEPA